MSLKDLIDRQRAALEEPKSEVLNVALAGELVKVEVLRLMPDEWQALVATHPVRPTSKADANIGYNTNTLPRDYPASRVRVAGEEVDAQTWADMWSVLNSVNKNNVHTVMWGLNVYDAIRELEDLGKALAGQQSGSPAN